MRTKHCRLIGLATCDSVQPVRLEFDPTPSVQIMDDIETGRALLDVFAHCDGFEDWAELCAFWEAEHGRPSAWSGVIIYWRDFRPGD